MNLRDWNSTNFKQDVGCVFNSFVNIRGQFNPFERNQKLIAIEIIDTCIGVVFKVISIFYVCLKEINL